MQGIIVMPMYWERMRAFSGLVTMESRRGQQENRFLTLLWKAASIIAWLLYFGGTLLGTGGLIRAYQAASKEGLEHSTVLSVSDGVLAQIDADYNSIGKIQYICLEMHIDILKTEYTENVYMEMIVQAENYGQFVQKITDAFSGKISVVKIQQQKFGKSESGEVILLSRAK